MFHFLSHKDIDHFVTRTQGSSSLPGGGVMTVILLPNEQLVMEMTDGQLSPTVVPPLLVGIVYLLQGEKEWLKQWAGVYLIFTLVIWRWCVWITLSGLVVLKTCSQMSFPTLWWSKVVVFRGCGGHMTVTGGDLHLCPCKCWFQPFKPNTAWHLIIFFLKIDCTPPWAWWTKVR